MVQRDHMPTFEVQTAQRTYQSVVERGILKRAAEFVPKRAGKLFVVTTEDVWNLYGQALKQQLPSAEVLFFPGGEANKRLSRVEELAEQMVARGAVKLPPLCGKSRIWRGRARCPRRQQRFSTSS